MYDGEKKLWLEVINMAISDAMNKRLNASNRRFALNWLCRDNIDFFIVCDLAGVHPEAIRRGFLKIKNRKNR
ncbi:MAG: hypothetical protein LBO02_02420 [Holosporaceae bacterium]|jgi:hypothetical protein|nr:hypothetical protein [Holosporaceae bacterium]